MKNHVAVAVRNERIPAFYAHSRERYEVVKPAESVRVGAYSEAAALHGRQIGHVPQKILAEGEFGIAPVAPEYVRQSYIVGVNRTVVGVRYAVVGGNFVCLFNVVGKKALRRLHGVHRFALGHVGYNAVINACHRVGGGSGAHGAAVCPGRLYAVGYNFFGNEGARAVVDENDISRNLFERLFNARKTRFPAEHGIVAERGAQRLNLLIVGGGGSYDDFVYRVYVERFKRVIERGRAVECREQLVFAESRALPRACRAYYCAYFHNFLSLHSKNISQSLRKGCPRRPFLRLP